MAAIGCLAPFILALIGAAIGHGVAGTSGLPWGLGAGFIGGGAIAAVLWYAFMRAKSED